MGEREREKQREEVREGWRGKKGREGVCVYVCIYITLLGHALPSCY